MRQQLQSDSLCIRSKKLDAPSLSSKSNSASLSLTSAGRQLTSTIGIVVTVVDPEDEDLCSTGVAAAANAEDEDMFVADASRRVLWLSMICSLYVCVIVVEVGCFRVQQLLLMPPASATSSPRPTQSGCGRVVVCLLSYRHCP